MNVINTYAQTIPHVLTTGHVTNDTLAHFAVLTQDETGQYAVYCAVVDLLCVTDEELRAVLAQQVAHKGIKQSYRDAVKYFPNVERDEYRR